MTEERKLFQRMRRDDISLFGKVWIQCWYLYAAVLAFPTLVHYLAIWQTGAEDPELTRRWHQEIEEVARKRKSKGLRWISRYLLWRYKDDLREQGYL